MEASRLRTLRMQIKRDRLDLDDALRRIKDEPDITQSEMARILDKTPKTISRRLAHVREADAAFAAEFADTAGTVTRAELDEMVPFNTAAFRAFYERFSGYPWPAHFTAWSDAFFRNRNMILNVPPRHAKTTWCRWLSVWLICQDRDVQILMISETSRFAITSAQYIANALTNPNITAAYGTFRPDTKGDATWSPGTGRLVVKDKARYSEGTVFTFLSLGSGQQTLGFGADVVILDDATNARITRSETDSKELIRYVREEALSRFLNNPRYHGGKAVVVGQRVAYGDLYAVLSDETYQQGALKGEPLFAVEMYPAVLSWERQEVLWPEVLDWDYIMAMYERLGANSFSTLFMQNPVPEGGAIVEEEWLERCRDRTRTLWQRKTYESTDLTSRIISVDPSPTMYTGIVVADVKYHNRVPTDFRMDVLDVDRVKFRNAEEMIRYIRRVTFEQGCDYVIVEDSAVSKVILEHKFFRELGPNGVKLIRHKTSYNKSDLEVGVRNLGPLWEFARISLPYADKEASEKSALLENEVRTWPNNRLSDLVMATWFLAYNHRAYVPAGAFSGHFDFNPASKGGYSFVKRAMLDRVKTEIGPNLLGTQDDPWAQHHLQVRAHRKAEAGRKEAIATTELWKLEQEGPLSRATNREDEEAAS